jgi:hypothetical protein
MITRLLQLGMEEAMIIMVDRDMGTMAVIMDLGMGTMGATMVDIMVGTIGVDTVVDIMPATMAGIGDS